MTTLYSRKSISSATAGRGCLLVAVALACFALSPAARAACNQGCSLLTENTFLGESALGSNTSGSNNTATGFNALASNTSGGSNTATGSSALALNTTGGSNTAVGLNALASNTTAGNNTATGSQALTTNTTGHNNTATGSNALLSNTTGGSNTANGVSALLSNTTGNSNTAAGVTALQSNTTGISNTADGANALHSNTTGADNTAVGGGALNKNTTAGNNTATGFQALFSNTTGTSNTAAGVTALQSNTTGVSNTADGASALMSNTSGSSNIAVGDNAGINLTTGNNNIDIGNDGFPAEANTIRIGNPVFQTATFIYGISGAMITGTSVVVNSSGQLGVPPSSERFKAKIEPMDKASEAILALKPVTFRYKHEIDPEGIRQFGLVAEEVEKVNPDLVARDDQGKPYTVRYDAVNAMLLNEFLKEHRKVTELEKQVEKLSAGLQKVSDQLELNKPAPRIVNNQ